MRVIEDRRAATTYGDIRSMHGAWAGGASSTSMLNGSAFNLSVRVISTISPNCVSVSQVDIKGSKLNKTPLA
jgi:hypothetical protein